MFIQKRKIMAEEEVQVAPEATDLLFEVEDVAELVAEVTGEEVEVTAEEEEVTFAVGEEEFVVQAEGDEEVQQLWEKSNKWGILIIISRDNLSKHRLWTPKDILLGRSQTLGHRKR